MAVGTEKTTGDLNQKELSFLDKIKNGTGGILENLIHITYSSDDGFFALLRHGGKELISRGEALELASELERYVELSTDESVNEINLELEIQCYMQGGFNGKKMTREDAIAFIKKENDGAVALSLPVAAKRRKGSVYLVHAAGTNRYKIGLTVNVQRRFSQLTKQSPYPLDLICSYECGDVIQEESYWHNHFSDCRVHREWFELTEEQVEEFKLNGK